MTGSIADHINGVCTKFIVQETDQGQVVKPLKGGKCKKTCLWWDKELKRCKAFQEG